MTLILVTGGLGFIGSAFIRRFAAEGADLINVDLNTYAGDERRLAAVRDLVHTEYLDVTDRAFSELVKRVRPSCIVHFAAETHVTRSENHLARLFS